MITTLAIIALLWSLGQSNGPSGLLLFVIAAGLAVTAAVL